MRANRENTFEASIVEHLTENGWVEGNPDDYSRELGLNTKELLDFIQTTQEEKWNKLVKIHGSENKAVDKLTKRIAYEITARGTLDVLRRGVKDLGTTLDLAKFAPAHKLTPEIQKMYDKNRLCITRQVHHSESNTQSSLDLLMFINGIPVSTAELKTQFTGQNVNDAIEQYRTARNSNDLIFKERVVVNFAVDQDNVMMCTKLAGTSTVFMPFNQGSEGPGKDGTAGNPLNPTGPRTAYLWEDVWQRDNWLKIIGSYVHVNTEKFTDSKGKTQKKTTTIFPRYHQWDVVEKLLHQAKIDGPGKNKLVQHSPGSGKSNSIAWLAYGLVKLHTTDDPNQLSQDAKDAGLNTNDPIFDKVIIITDRVVLDRQLQATIAGFEHKPGMVETIDRRKNSEDLRAALEGSAAKIIVTTLQKFPVVAQAATDLTGTRFAVIADEAHASQTGEAVKELKAVLKNKNSEEALEIAEKVSAAAENKEKDLEDVLVESAQARGKQNNLTFYAFTATPKVKTLEMFGEKTINKSGKETLQAFHLYSMRQAIDEGFILDVLANYTTYKTYYRLVNSDQGDDPMLPKGKAAAQLARFVNLHPSNLAQKAEIIVEHYRAHTQGKIGGKAKAMVVTRSRLHAVRYLHAINKYIEKSGYNKGPKPIKVLVAFSGTVVDPDAPTVEYRESLLNGIGESALPEKFESDEYQILVVAEKYQTGFDQPLLHTMYIDKPLVGVKAVQTIMRLDRTCPGKEDTFVLDFVNDVESIQESFKPYYTNTLAAPTDPNILYTLQRRILDADVVDPDEITKGVNAILVGGTKGSKALNAAIDPALERYDKLDEDAQEDFKTALRDFVQAYAFLAQIMPFIETELEELYYYSKYLHMRLPKNDQSGQVNVDGAVLLTHIRTEMVDFQKDASLDEGTEDPLSREGGGTGIKPPETEEHLSNLIKKLNSAYGMKLTEADQILFDQQLETLRQNPDIQNAAKDNDKHQFGVYVRPKISTAIILRKEANDELLQAYLDKPGVQTAIDEDLLERLYNTLTTEETA